MSAADTATTRGVGTVPTVETAPAAASTKGGLADGPGKQAQRDEQTLHEHAVEHVPRRDERPRAATAPSRRPAPRP